MIAYLVHRFPVATQTFTLDELEIFKSLGLATTVFSFRPGEDTGWNVNALDVRMLPSPTSLAYARVLLIWFWRAPLRLLRCLSWVLLGHFLHRPTLRERAAAILSLPRGALLADWPDVELFHAQFANETATTALVASHLSRKPFSFRSHTAPNPQLLKEKLRRARVVLSISEYDRADLLSLVPDARVVLAPLGIPLPPPASTARVEGLIASVGSLIEKKGHDVLIDACAQLRADGIRVRCDIAGEGPLRDALQSKIDELGLTGIVRLRGQLSRADVLGLVASASVFVLASVPSDVGIDGIPVALIEAMAMSTPPVSTELSGIPELVRGEKTGLLVPPGDARALAAAIRRFLENNDLARRIGEDAARQVRADRDAKTRYADAAQVLRSAILG